MAAQQLGRSETSGQGDGGTFLGRWRFDNSGEILGITLLHNFITQYYTYIRILYLGIHPQQIPLRNVEPDFLAFLLREHTNWLTTRALLNQNWLT